MALALGSCGESPLLTFDQYLAQCETIKGKPVRAAGYLGTCAGYECELFANKAQRQAWMQYIVALQDLARTGDPQKRRAKQAAIKPSPTKVGIGSANDFDRRAERFQYSYVVITGRVDKDDCTGEGGLDRTFGVIPNDIRTWTKSEGAPANTE
jgi:hypothetical protein